jgi:exodeoxyribonuclease-3
VREDGRVLRVVTVNVNGVRAAFNRGMGAWIDRRLPDVMLLQEVRAPAAVLGALLPDGWHLAQDECELKGRAGVAIASRRPHSAVRVGLGGRGSAHTGRWVEADVELATGGSLTLVSTYLHSGTAGTASMADKYALLDLATARLAELAELGRHVVVGGDLNIAHRDVDLKNWKGNLRAAGCLPAERAYLDRWFDDLGWRDLGRELGGAGPGPYTWWSWRGKAFDNDAGWRIDYQLATPDLADAAVTAAVDRAPAYDQRWSDHAPLVVGYDL